jgi:hypothetical protein
VSKLTTFKQRHFQLFLFVGKNAFLNASSQTRRLNTTPAAPPEGRADLSANIEPKKQLGSAGAAGTGTAERMPTGVKKRIFIYR